MAELEAILTANIRQLENQLKRAEKELKDYGDAAGNANKRAERSFNRLGKGAANANPALQDVGRVIQDLPFGIRGVGNNIDQLFASFNNLSRSSGGVRNALSAILSGLTGPAGIAIGVSSVIALFTTLEASGTTLTDALNFLSGGLDEAARAQRDFNKEANEGVGAAKSEAETLNALLNVARDVSQATETRRRAIAEINEEYGKYLPNITQENINTKAVVDAIDLYNAALIRKAKITAAQNLISEEFSKILELQQKDFISSANALDFLVAGLQSYGNSAGVVGNIAEKGFQRQQKEITEAERRLQSFRETLQALLTEDLQVGGIATSSAGGDAAAVRAAQERVAIVEGLVQGLADTGFNAAQAIQTTTDQTLNTYSNFVGGIIDLTGALSGGISSGFASIGQALAQGGNVIGAVGQAILQTLGGIITQIGQASIAAGVAALALKNLFASPGAAIAAGAALVTIGSALSSARGAVSNIGTGSVGGQGTTSFSGSNTTSFSNGGFSEGRVVFEISGQKLIGVLNNSLSANQRLGGNVTIGG